MSSQSTMRGAEKPLALSFPQAAKASGISIATLRELANAGTIKSITDRKRTKVVYASLSAYLNGGAE